MTIRSKIIQYPVLSTSVVMATIRCLSLQTGEQITMTKQQVLCQVEQTEKKSFARQEAFDFSNELQKRNLELVVIVKGAGSLSLQLTVVAYLVFAYVKPGNTVTLQKVCVRKEFRRQGIAKATLAAQTKRLTDHGTTKVQLWVDESNLAARRLYNCIGFEEVCRFHDYYAVGRTGIQMALRLGHDRCDA